LIKAPGRTIHSAIHEFNNYTLSKVELPEVWKESIIVPNYKKCDKTIIIEVYHFCQLHKILSSILLSRLTPYAEKLLTIMSVNFNVTSQLLILYYAFIKYLRRNGNNMKQCISFA